ncbi:hypothetical protein C8R45DRAFT_1159328 [Mycena sanguinolenta]|nr:hypothetical protein C8R45DRAFT_1159328 [Mycena sanguinolenta]
MMTWTAFRDEYLDERLRLEGRGGVVCNRRCASCEDSNPLFRCAHQTCHGPEMFCEACIAKKHSCLPTHWIEEWNGEYFERRSLYDLGLVIQLGHPHGYFCPTSRPAHKDFVVIDVNGVHNVCVHFCECDARIKHRQQLMRVRWWPATVKDPQTGAIFAVVRLFQIMNCLGKVSAHDFVRSLELLTNNDGLSPPPNRRRAFRHIVRQYRMTLMMKRAGRGHAPSGVNGTAQGELALRCRACPQDGRNLPDGWNNINWDEVAEDLRYKYFLFLAQGCNFRLINRDVGTATKDPIIGDGLGYFVNHAKYTEYLRAPVSEEEISTCSGFQVMFWANKKRVKGLRTTAVGGVTCARHNMWRPNGIGDLQLGERYCNKDFILLSAILNFVIFYLILWYDIACQYGKNFWRRMPELPGELQITLPESRVWFKVPNFHLPPHKPLCHSPFSFHWMWGAGLTHGETVEQNWEFINGAAASTKMMGIGTRHATLEDLFGFHNWRRLVAWRGIFTRRMKENVKEGQVHRDAFHEFDAALEEKVPELVMSWKAWVHEWESKQHTDGTESPFEVQEKVATMKEIRLKLAKEELLRSGEGVEVEREDTPSTFIGMGLEIEELQRQLAVDIKAVTNPTSQQEHDFLKRCTAIGKRIRAFRKLQRAGLPDIEATLRETEAHETLEALRQGLRVRTLMNRPRPRNTTGQRALTRGQGILPQNNAKIHKAKLRYRYVRNALSRLRGHSEWEWVLQVLNDNDIRALNERAVTVEEKAQREARRRTLSWIWYTAKAGDPSEQELVEALRVEWCKAYARMRRWHEDVVLVEEEMRRTIEYGYWQAREWLERSVGRESMVGDELQEGLKAYALEQVHRETRTCEDLTTKWGFWREQQEEDEEDDDGEEGAPEYDDEEEDAEMD